MLDGRRLQTDAEELLGLRGKKENSAVRWKDLKGRDFATAALGAIGGTGSGGTPALPGGNGTTVKDLIDAIKDARDQADLAAAAAQNANVAAGLAQQYADAMVAQALRDMGENFEIMESGFALSAQAQGRDRICLNDTFFISSDWGRYSSGGTLTVLENRVFPIGRTMDFQVTAAQSDGLQIIGSPGTIWTGPKDAAGYVIELDYTSASGSLAGAGVRLTWRNAAGIDFGVSVPISAMQAGDEVAGTARVVRALIRKPSNFSGTFASHSLFVMANWSGLGAMSAKRIQFHRASLRLATPDEIQSGQPLPGIRAFLAANYMTAASTSAAIANADLTLNTSLADTFAKVQQTSTAIASLNGSVARFRNIVSVDGGYQAGIELVAFNGAGTGTGSAVKLIGDEVIAEGTLSAAKVVVHDGSGNLFPDPQFTLLSKAGWVGFPSDGDVRPLKTSDIPNSVMRTNAPAATVLYMRNHGGTGTITLVNQAKFNCKAGDVFNLSMDYAVLGGGNHRCHFRVRWHNALDEVIGYSGGLIRDTAPVTWSRYAINVTAPTDAVYGQQWIRSEDDGNMNAFACATNFANVKRRTAATLLTPNSVTTDLLVAEDFALAGIGIFGGTLQSDNYSASAGTGWRITRAGSMVMPDASVGTLKIAGNAVTIPVVQTLANQVDGGSWQTANTAVINMPDSGQATILWFASQSYSDNNSPALGLRLYVDGSLVWDRMTGDPPGSRGLMNDWMSMGWSRWLSAGSHTIRVDWYGANSSVRIHTRTLMVTGSLR